MAQRHLGLFQEHQEAHRLTLGGWAVCAVTLEPSGAVEALELGHGTSSAAGMGPMRSKGLASRHVFIPQVCPPGHPRPGSPRGSCTEQDPRKDLAPPVPCR